MSNERDILEVLTQLHSSGIRISIDDFGTGYSSLVYLRRLPVDQIKIDRSFVSSMLHDENATTIVRSTIDLGHSLGLEVVAEGVEDDETWALLADLGCDLAQGYALSRPMPAQELLRWAKKWNRIARKRLRKERRRTRSLMAAPWMELM
jgi:EAL domain-containing protein (putative c-di-GMP-specific phosphodiesterase class I)